MRQKWNSLMGTSGIDERVLLWHSPPPWNGTGYGVQTFSFMRMLQQDGYKVFNIPNCQFEGKPNIMWEGFPILAGGANRWGVDAVLHYGVKMQAPVFTLMDVWPLAEDLGLVLRKQGKGWYPLAPIDHDPIPVSVTARLKHAEVPIAFSRFGFDQMKSASLKPYYLPHGVDTEVYMPKRKDKGVINGARDDKFLVGVVAANIGEWDRKGWHQCIEAFSILHDRHPDTNLFIWSIVDRSYNGLDIISLVKQFGVEDAVMMTDKWTIYEGVTSTQMAEIYNALDVLFLPTRGEGFGVLLIEAQACGVPVITTAFSAAKELVGSGWAVPPKDLLWTNLDSFQALPDTEKLADALCEAYDVWKGGKMAEMNAKAKAFAVDYDFRTVYAKHFKPLLARIYGKAKTKNRDD